MLFLGGAVAVWAISGHLFSWDLVENERREPNRYGVELYGRAPRAISVTEDRYLGTMVVVAAVTGVAVAASVALRLERREPLLRRVDPALWSLVAWAAVLGALWATSRLAGDRATVVGIFRHGAALDLASWVSIAWSWLAVAVGAAWVVEDRMRRRVDVSRTVWGTVLALLGAFLAIRFHSVFRYLWNCC